MLDPYAALTEALVDATERLDDRAFDLQLRRAMCLGSGSAMVDRVILPALERIGTRWHEGSLSVAQEHFASHRLGASMRELLRLSTAEEAEPRTLIACFADEEHDIGALAVAMHLALWGTRPLFLGARTPPAALRTAVEGVRPKLVALSVTMPPSGTRARELVAQYGHACEGVPWMVGGAGASAIADLVQQAGGLLAPHDPGKLRNQVRQAIHSRGPVALP
jgi:methanogenic corrinoid protein MtbC1